MKRHIKNLVTIAALLLLAAPYGFDAFAWSMGGHRVTGIIAARQIAADAPQVAAAIIAIMKEHPSSTAFQARIDEAGTDPLLRLERLFAETAQWPDEVRSGPFRQYHRGEWHTIGIPFIGTGFRPAVEPQIPVENLLWALRENARIAADPGAAAADRAVALCWLFHLVGDLHQPLHAVTLFRDDFPDGDRFGTRFWIVPPNGGETVSLHYFWDSVIQRSQNAAEIEKNAGALRSANPPAALEEMRRLPYRGAESFARWIYDESHALAISAAYRSGGLAGGADKKSPMRLSEEYAAGARAIAARRMALSGYRLAEVLRALFP